LYNLSREVFIYLSTSWGAVQKGSVFDLAMRMVNVPILVC